MKEKIAVVGAGSWATALAVSLARHHSYVYMWARRDAQVEEINTKRRNQRYLPGIEISEGVIASNSLKEVLKGAEMVVAGVPSHSFREVLQVMRLYLEPGSIIINTAKGLEVDSLMRLSEVFEEIMGESERSRFVVLSGPSHAEEVAMNTPTAVVAASTSVESAQRAQDLFMDHYLRVYTNPDVPGVELGGALKNIIALGTGVADGLEFGDNTIAALVTRGLAEITRLGTQYGANPLTFNGLAGIGDLMVTCTSKHSRNRRAGRELGRGKNLEDTLQAVDMVVEGVRTTKAAYKLAEMCEVDMPITEQMYNLLFEGLPPRNAVINLMSRGRRHEIEEVAMSGIKSWSEKL